MYGFEYGEIEREAANSVGYILFISVKFNGAFSNPDYVV
jgi:hypothetical protein